MPNFSHQSWKHFILNHPDFAVIETGSKDLAGVLRSSHEPVSEGDKLIRLVALQSSPSTVLISLNPFNDKIIGSFLHEPFGIRFDSPMVNGHVKCLALTGFGEQATPIYIDTDRLFMATETAHPSPTLQQMLSFHDREPGDLIDLIADQENPKNINLVGVLPPSLAHVIIEQEDGDHPHVLLLKTIKAVHAMIDEADPENLEEVEHLYPLLLTIWGFCNNNEINDLYTANAAATDIPALTWSTTKHKHCLHPIINIDDDNTQVSALNRLASTIEASNTSRFIAASTVSPSRSAASTKDTETSSDEDELVKAWNKIPGVFRQGILFASSEDGSSAPAYPSDKLLALVHCKNGATATRLIARWHANLDLTIQAGMALNITRGMVCSQPDPMAIDTFSPFFCPPSRAGFNNISNDELNSLELSSQSFNLSQKDIHKMTKCKPFIPMAEMDTIDMMTNYHAINSDIFGENSVGTRYIQDLINHYDENKMKYHRCFEAHQWFGLWLVNRLHYKHQSYLHSCFFADDVHDIDFDRYNLRQEMDAIDGLSFRADPPTWALPIITAFTDNNVNNRDTNPSPRRSASAMTVSQGSSTRHVYRDMENQAKRTKVLNNIQDPDTIIKSNERYASLVHFRNLEKCKEKAVRLNDTFICNNWHIRGNCHTNCRRSATHSPLPTETKNKYREYVAALRQCQADYDGQTDNQNRRNNNRTRHERSQGERT